MAPGPLGATTPASAETGRPQATLVAKIPMLRERVIQVNFFFPPSIMDEQMPMAAIDNDPFTYQASLIGRLVQHCCQANCAIGRLGL